MRLDTCGPAPDLLTSDELLAVPVVPRHSHKSVSLQGRRGFKSLCAEATARCGWHDVREVCSAIHPDRLGREFYSQVSFPVYEIVVRFRQREEVIETVDSLEYALARVQVYKRQGVTAYFRPTIRRAA